MGEGGLGDRLEKPRRHTNRLWWLPGQLHHPSVQSVKPRAATREHQPLVEQPQRPLKRPDLLPVLRSGHPLLARAFRAHQALQRPTGNAAACRLSPRLCAAMCASGDHHQRAQTCPCRGWSDCARRVSLVWHRAPPGSDHGGIGNRSSEHHHHALYCCHLCVARHHGRVTHGRTHSRNVPIYCVARGWSIWPIPSAAPLLVKRSMVPGVHCTRLGRGSIKSTEMQCRFHGQENESGGPP